MKVAISTDNGYVSAHFGRCPEFTILETLMRNAHPHGIRNRAQSRS